TGETEVLYDACDGVAFGGPNDLVFDETGSFWFTDFYGGRIYYAAADGSSIVEAISGVDHPNGIGLSPDGSVLYWAESHRRQIVRRRLSAPGAIVPSTGCPASTILNGSTPDPFSVRLGMPGAGD